MYERYFRIFKANGNCPGSYNKCVFCCGVALSNFCETNVHITMNDVNKERKEFVLSKLIAAGYEERIFEELL